MAVAEDFAALTQRKRREEEELGAINEELRSLEGELLALHPTSGVGSSVNLASGGTLIVASKMSAKKTDEDALVKWLDGNGLADFAKRSVNTNSLSALCRERAEKGEPIPDGVELASFKQVSWRK